MNISTASQIQNSLSAPAPGSAGPPVPPQADAWSDTGASRLAPPPAAPSPSRSPRFPEPRSSRLPSAAEFLGWAGGILTLMGVAAVTVDQWGSSMFGGWPLFGLLSLATAVTAAAAVQVATLDREGTDRIAGGLATGLGVMAGISGIWTTYVGVDTAVGGEVLLGALAAATATTCLTGVVARRTGRDLWWAATAASAAVTAFCATALGTEDQVVRASAVGIVGAVALLAAVLIRPSATRISQGTGLAIMFAGAQSALLMGPLPWAAVVIDVVFIAVAVVVALRAPRDMAWWTGGAALLLTASLLTEQFPGLVRPSTAILVGGLGMTTACIVLARRAGQSG